MLCQGGCINCNSNSDQKYPLPYRIWTHDLCATVMVYPIIFNFRNKNTSLSTRIFIFQGNPINKPLVLDSPIKAVDQDLSLNASIEYTINSGKKHF